MAGHAALAGGDEGTAVFLNPQTVARLNETPASTAAARLLAAAGVSLHGDLALAVLSDWATENLAADSGWAQAVDQAVALGAYSDPDALVENLSAPGIEEAETLEEAGRALLRWVVDIIRPGTQPA